MQAAAQATQLSKLKVSRTAEICGGGTCCNKHGTCNTTAATETGLDACNTQWIVIIASICGPDTDLTPTAIIYCPTDSGALHSITHLHCQSHNTVIDLHSSCNFTCRQQLQLTPLPATEITFRYTSSQTKKTDIPHKINLPYKRWQSLILGSNQGWKKPRFLSFLYKDREQKYNQKAHEKHPYMLHRILLRTSE